MDQATALEQIDTIFRLIGVEKDELLLAVNDIQDPPEDLRWFGKEALIPVRIQASAGMSLTIKLSVVLV